MSAKPSRRRNCATKVESLLTVVSAAAEGDLTREVTIKGPDPVGQMGEGLETLLADLRASMSAHRGSFGDVGCGVPMR